MIADTEADKKLSPMVREVIFRGRKLNILLTFTSQPFFKVPKTIRINEIQKST